MTAPDTDAIVDMAARFERLYTASVYDVMDEMGLPNQCMALGIKPLNPDWVVAGTALTMKWTAETRHPLDLHKMDDRRPNMFSLINLVQPGCVLVMETGKSMNGRALF